MNRFLQLTKSAFTASVMTNEAHRSVESYPNRPLRFIVPFAAGIIVCFQPRRSRCESVATG